MSLTVTVPADAPALERGSAAAYLLGTLIADFNLLPPEHRSALRGVAAHLIDALDEYESAPAAPRVAHELNELELQLACREIAEAFGQRLPGVGFALLLFGANTPCTVYMSNVARPQMLEALREFLKHAERGAP